MRNIILFLFLVFFLVLEVNSQSRLAPPNDPNATARSGQAEIIINASNAERDIAVWVNGNIVAHIPPRSSEKIIVNNGENLVEAADTTIGSRTGQWNTAAKKKNYRVLQFKLCDDWDDYALRCPA